MTLKEQVKMTLMENEATRNSDILLMITLWETYYPEKIRDGAVRLVNLYSLPTQEAIKRYRADLNSKGQLLPTEPEVIKARKLEENKWRKELGYKEKPIKQTSKLL